MGQHPELPATVVLEQWSMDTMRLSCRNAPFNSEAVVGFRYLNFLMFVALLVTPGCGGSESDETGLTGESAVSTKTDSDAVDGASSADPSDPATEPTGSGEPADSSKSTSNGEASTDAAEGQANRDQPDGGPTMPPMPSKRSRSHRNVVFVNKPKTNSEPPESLDGLTFITTNDTEIAMSDYRGKKHVVLVFTQGFSGILCPFCKTHTSRLVANYDKFVEQDAEVLVVYPGPREHVDEFLEAARTNDKQQVDRVPFPIVLDREMKAVDFFGIRSNLAHPATYVIDKQGNVQLAYVGKDMSPDRPSIKALLEILKAAQDRG